MFEVTYCKTWFMLISAGKTGKDVSAYLEFLNLAGGELLLKPGLCSRFGQESQVIYDEREQR
jgi:hypothetical protein